MNFSQLYWIVPLTLIFIAIIQTMYWILLNRSAGQPNRRNKISPTMPTSPRGASNAPNTMGGIGNDFTDSMQTGGFQGTMTVLEGIPGTTEIRLPKSSFSLGRFYNPDEDILIALDERSISRRHAYFSAEGNNFYLTDIGSSYGTAIYMNDTYVNLSPDQREQVYNGDVILFGNTVKIQLRLPGQSRK